MLIIYTWRAIFISDQTGLPWVNPSPNIRSLREALLYAGVGLLEATNLSVGRGTATPTTQTAPPVLIIDAKPGGAQVYIDDELVGTTSSQGRLKLPQLNPGEHRVRLALLGHQDYEDKIELRPGETTRLLANLEAAKAAPPSCY